MFDERPVEKIAKARKFPKGMSAKDIQRYKWCAEQVAKNFPKAVCKSYHKRRNRAVFVVPGLSHRGSIHVEYPG